MGAGEFGALVRRVDEDRWLASRFASRDARARLTALYALNYEIARTSEAVTQPGLGAIRLAWWHEALADARVGKPTPPALSAFARAAGGYGTWGPVLERMIEARSLEFQEGALQSGPELENYVDATAGGVMRLALHACEQNELETFVRCAARAWGLAGLLRAAPAWFGLTDAERAALADRAHEAYAEAAGLSRTLPASAFPAIGYVALLPSYLRVLARGRGAAPLFVRQMALVKASAIGRL